jgi:hypothetical protein
MPVTLSALESNIIHDAARPLDCHQRDDFVEAVLGALDNVECCGPGVVYRTCRAVQRQYFDRPMNAKGTVSHAGRSKLRSGPALA